MVYKLHFSNSPPTGEENDKSAMLALSASIVADPSDPEALNNLAFALLRDIPSLPSFKASRLCHFSASSASPITRV